MPVPTVTKMEPPRPPVVAPDPTYRAPLLPPGVPELKTRRPLTPAVPALAVRIVNEPLLEAVPSPVAILRAPPVCSVLESRKNAQLAA